MSTANLQAEWAAVSETPFTTIGIAVFIALAAWAIVHFIYKRLISGLERDLESEQAEAARLRGRVSEYEQKAGGSPDEVHARIEALENRLARMSGRRLSNEQKDRLTASLAQDRGSVSIQFAMGTPDGYKLQKDYGEVFQRAGWQVSGGQVMGGPFGERGLTIYLFKDISSSKNVVAALGAAGLAFDLVDRTSEPREDCDMVIIICPVED